MEEIKTFDQHLGDMKNNLKDVLKNKPEQKKIGTQIEVSQINNTLMWTDQ